MSDYEAVYATGLGSLLWRVQQTDGDATVKLAYCFTQTDAERIARALRLLDTMEQDEFTAAQHRAMRLQVLDATTTEPQP